jgi:hypothetical protein
VWTALALSDGTRPSPSAGSCSQWCALLLLGTCRAAVRSTGPSQIILAASGWATVMLNITFSWSPATGTALCSSGHACRWMVKSTQREMQASMLGAVSCQAALRRIETELHLRSRHALSHTAVVAETRVPAWI